MGAVLEQRISGKWRPLAFFSRQLRRAERNYATFDRELLGIHLAIKHFRYFVEGRRFTVFTDHKPIVAALRKATEPASGRQARQLAAIAEAERAAEQARLEGTSKHKNKTQRNFALKKTYMYKNRLPAPTR